MQMLRPASLKTTIGPKEANIFRPPPLLVPHVLHSTMSANTGSSPSFPILRSVLEMFQLCRRIGVHL